MPVSGGHQVIPSELVITSTVAHTANTNIIIDAKLTSVRFSRRKATSPSLGFSSASLDPSIALMPAAHFAYY